MNLREVCSTAKLHCTSSPCMHQLRKRNVVAPNVHHPFFLAPHKFPVHNLLYSLLHSGMLCWLQACSLCRLLCNESTSLSDIRIILVYLTWQAETRPITRSAVAALLDGATPLHAAALRGNPAQIDHLLFCKADPMARTAAGQLPFELVPVCDYNKPSGLILHVLMPSRHATSYLRRQISRRFILCCAL